MVELIQQSDLKLIDNQLVYSCVERRFSHLPDDFIYPDYGYFAIVEKADNLFGQMSFSYGPVPHVETIFDFLEIVEEDTECFEIVLVLTQDFGVSLIIPKTVLSAQQINHIRSYKGGAK